MTSYSASFYNKLKCKRTNTVIKVNAKCQENTEDRVFKSSRQVEVEGWKGMTFEMGLGGGK